MCGAVDIAVREDIGIREERVGRDCLDGRWSGGVGTSLDGGVGD